MLATSRACGARSAPSSRPVRLQLHLLVLELFQPALHVDERLGNIFEAVAVLLHPLAELD